MQLWINSWAIATNKYTKAAMQIKIMPQFFMRVQILNLFKPLEVHYFIIYLFSSHQVKF